MLDIVRIYVSSSAQAASVQVGYEFHYDLSDESIRVLASHEHLRNLNAPAGSYAEARFRKFHNF